MDGWSFQHFHDNTLPLAYQARQAFDLMQGASDCVFKEQLRADPEKASILTEEWALLGFDVTKRTSTQETTDTLDVILAKVPSDDDQQRVHPIHVQWLQRGFPPRKAPTKKVIYLSRQGANSHGRQLENEELFVDYLQSQTKNVVEYNPMKQGLNTLEQLTNLLGDACAIVGLHGGGLYNQFFANEKTAIIEVLPVDSRGLIHKQGSPDSRPPLAHRAFWHNANLLGQPYWRIHYQVENSDQFAMDSKVMETVGRALSLSGCSNM
jgi:hypothetical protein